MRLTGVTLKDGGKVKFGSFNVIVGPNSVGKSTFLLELFNAATGHSSNRPIYQVSEPEHDHTITPEMARLLLASVFPNEAHNVQENARFVFKMKRSLPHQPRHESQSIFISQATHNALEEIAKNGKPSSVPNQDRQALRQMLFKHHPSGERIDPSIFMAAVSPASQPAPNAINALNDDPGKLALLQRQFHQDYGIHLLLLDHERTTLALGTAPEDLPGELCQTTAGKARCDRIERWKTQVGYSSLSDAGDGMKAKVKLMMSIWWMVDIHLLRKVP